MDMNQVTLPSTDIERSAAFYALLGLRQIVSDPPHYARFEGPDGGGTFSLHHVDTAPSNSGVVVYFECPDLEGVHAALVARGVSFLSAPTDQPWLWREARLRDPDGNELCLYHAGVNRRHPPWRLP